MATTQAKTKKPTPAPATKPIAAKAKTTYNAPPLPFIFERENYIIMIAGIGVIVLGFLLMMGSPNNNPATFPTDEIYSFRRITLAPIVVMIGFLIEIYAILKRPTVA